MDLICNSLERSGDLIVKSDLRVALDSEAL